MKILNLWGSFNFLVNLYNLTAGDNNINLACRRLKRASKQTETQQWRQRETRETKVNRETDRETQTGKQTKRGEHGDREADRQRQTDRLRQGSVGTETDRQKQGRRQIEAGRCRDRPTETVELIEREADWEDSSALPLCLSASAGLTALRLIIVLWHRWIVH